MRTGTKRVAFNTPTTVSSSPLVTPRCNYYGGFQEDKLRLIWNWIADNVQEPRLDEYNVNLAINRLQIDQKSTFGPNRQVSHLVEKMKRMGLGSV